jgi:DNA-binding Lrp family transcriptional regulator
MLSDKDIEKRMVEALDEGGRHTVDELVKSTGIDEKRIWKALQALESEELCAHITLEGTPRWYGTVPHVKDDPPAKKVRMYHSPPKQPCPKCGGMYGPSGMAKHIKACKGKTLLQMVDCIDKVIDKETGAISTAHVTAVPPADYTITGPQMPIPYGVDAVIALAERPNVFRILLPDHCTMDIIGWRIRFDKDGPILESMEPASTLIIRREK